MQQTENNESILKQHKHAARASLPFIYNVKQQSRAACRATCVAALVAPTRTGLIRNPTRAVKSFVTIELKSTDANIHHQINLLSDFARPPIAAKNRRGIQKISGEISPAGRPFPLKEKPPGRQLPAARHNLPNFRHIPVVYLLLDIGYERPR
jgi:hypothetical protein